jgi:hypothetical protein
MTDKTPTGSKDLISSGNVVPFGHKSNTSPIPAPISQNQETFSASYNPISNRTRLSMNETDKDLQERLSRFQQAAVDNPADEGWFPLVSEFEVLLAKMIRTGGLDEVEKLIDRQLEIAWAVREECKG